MSAPSDKRQSVGSVNEWRREQMGLQNVTQMVVFVLVTGPQGGRGEEITEIIKLRKERYKGESVYLYTYSEA